MKEAGIAGDDVDLVYMGNCLPAGQGQAPARQAGIKAELPKGAQATRTFTSGSRAVRSRSWL